MPHQVGDRVLRHHDYTFGHVLEVVEGGYRVRYDIGEESVESENALKPVRTIGGCPDDVEGEDLPFVSD